jgi:uncharacterized protein YxeA
MNYINFLLIIFIILIIIILKINYYKNIENFDDFSPYINNQAYPYFYQKNLDSKLLQKTLKKWEDPFNSNNDGYYNAEPNKLPPLVPLYNYSDKKC